MIAGEDGLTAVRRLLDVLAWYTSTGSDALGGRAPRLAPAVAVKAEFLAGLYVTLGFKLAKRSELSRHTVYQLFVRERGLRAEQVPEALREDCRVVSYDHFMDTLADLGRHIANVSGLYPRLDAAVDPVAGDLLMADERSGEMRIIQGGSAAELLEEVAAGVGTC